MEVTDAIRVLRQMAADLAQISRSLKSGISEDHAVGCVTCPNKHYSDESKHIYNTRERIRGMRWQVKKLEKLLKLSQVPLEKRTTGAGSWGIPNRTAPLLSEKWVLLGVPTINPRYTTLEASK